MIFRIEKNLPVGYPKKRGSCFDISQMLKKVNMGRKVRNQKLLETFIRDDTLFSRCVSMCIKN